AISREIGSTLARLDDVDDSVQVRVRTRFRHVPKLVVARCDGVS
ncbi:MAG: hypothetical protein RL573_1148, partial [Actinomycetota bacterium]